MMPQIPHRGLIPDKLLIWHLLLDYVHRKVAHDYSQSYLGEFKHEVRQFQKPYDNQQAEQISLMV